MKAFAAYLTILAIAAVAPVQAQTALANSASVAKPYTTSATTIGTLLADPAAKAIVDKYIPGVSENPQISMVASMTLRALQPMSADKITDDKLAAIDADLAKLSAK